MSPYDQTTEKRASVGDHNQIRYNGAHIKKCQGRSELKNIDKFHGRPFIRVQDKHVVDTKQ